MSHYQWFFAYPKSLLGNLLHVFFNQQSSCRFFPYFPHPILDHGILAPCKREESTVKQGMVSQWLKVEEKPNMEPKGEGVEDDSSPTFQICPIADHTNEPVLDTPIEKKHQKRTGARIDSMESWECRWMVCRLCGLLWPFRPIPKWYSCSQAQPFVVLFFWCFFYGLGSHQMKITIKRKQIQAT